MPRAIRAAPSKSTNKIAFFPPNTTRRALGPTSSAVAGRRKPIVIVVIVVAVVVVVVVVDAARVMRTSRSISDIKRLCQFRVPNQVLRFDQVQQVRQVRAQVRQPCQVRVPDRRVNWNLECNALNGALMRERDCDTAGVSRDDRTPRRQRLKTSPSRALSTNECRPRAILCIPRPTRRTCSTARLSSKKCMHRCNVGPNTYDDSDMLLSHCKDKDHWTVITSSRRLVARERRTSAISITSMPYQARLSALQIS